VLGQETKLRGTPEPVRHPSGDGWLQLALVIVTVQLQRLLSVSLSLQLVEPAEHHLNLRRGSARLGL
jgi:hypothetical protein